MNDTLLSILTLALACVAFQRSYSFYGKGRPGAAIFFIVLAGFVLRCYASMDFFLHPWDERFHALIAKNLINHPLIPTLYDHPVLPFDYRDWTANHVWLNKPPLAFCFMALSLKLFGFNEIAVRIPSLIFSTASIYLTYVIGKLVFEERVGLLAAFLHAINGFLIDLASGRAGEDHVDTAFLFFIEFGVCLAVLNAKRNKNAFLPFIGIATGLAILTRYLPGLVVVPVWLAFVWKKDSWKSIAWKLSLILVVTVCVFLPWNLYLYLKFPKESAWVQQVNYRHLFEAIDEHKGSVFYHLLNIPRIFGELAYIPLGFYMARAFRTRQDGYFYGILAWFLVPYLFFSLVATKLPGYPMIAAAAVFLMLSYSWWQLKAQNGLIMSALVVLIIALPVRYSLERLKVFAGYERNPQWAQQLRSLNEQSYGERVVIFNTAHPAETMFYTPYIAYRTLPTPDQEKSLSDQGFTILYRNGEELIPSSLDGNDTAYESQTLPPFPWKRGQTYTVSITMKNTGITRWQYPRVFGPFYFMSYALMRNEPRCSPSPDNWGIDRAALPFGTSVSKGESFTFTFRVKAPSAAGTYGFRWFMRMRTPSGLQTHFGKPTPLVCVPVE